MLLLNAPRPSAAQPPCGAVLTRHTVLTEDLRCSGDGLVLGGDDVTLDCAGHAIRGSGGTEGIGVRAAGVAGASIRACTISGFLSAVRAETSPGLTITENSLVANLGAGVFAEGCARLRVENNRFENQFAHILARYCPDARIHGNEFEPGFGPHGWYGHIVTESSPRLAITSNTSSRGVGIFASTFELGGSDDTVVTDNDLQGPSSIQILYASRCLVAGNHLGPVSPDVPFAFAGVTLVGSRDCRVTDNAIEGHRILGMLLRGEYGRNGEVLGADRNVIDSNSIRNATDGIFLFGASENILAGNSISGAEVALLVSPETIPPARADHNLISGNLIEGGSLGLVTVDASGAADRS